MNFSMLPPEVNSARMFVGAGSGPMLSAAAAWDGLAAELQDAAGSFSSIVSGLSGSSWRGPAAAAMTAVALPYAGWLTGAAAQAKSAVCAFEAAQAATIHPLLVAANRNAFVRLVMSNLFGLNAPAIAAAEGQYEEMWAQDVTAMLAYHADASAVAAQLQPFQQLAQSLPGQVASAATGGPDIALSAFGTTLFQSGTAHASSGFGGVALAFGLNSNATANTTTLTPGFGSFATAIGDNNVAVANGTLCTATVVGNGSKAVGGFGGIGSTALVTGDHSTASAGFSNRDNGNVAVVAGNCSDAFAGSGNANGALVYGDHSGVRAGGNPLVGGVPASNLNLAFAQGDSNSASAGTLNSNSSNGNIAGVLFGYHGSASSGDGNVNVATVLSGSHGTAFAYNGNANLAGTVGGSGCTAHATNGSLNAAGVAGLLPGTDNLSADASGGLKTSFKFLPAGLDFLGP